MYTEKDIIKNINSYCSKIIILDDVGSTNTYIKENIADLNDKTIVCAKKQSTGRGRRGRSFLSPEGGLYFSILLRPDTAVPNISMLTVSAAVAVSNAIESICKIHSEIKWVNDIYLSGKKVCGILCEAGSSGGTNNFDYIVVGIGINITLPQKGFDKEISDIACALSQYTDNINVSRLIAAIYDGFIKYSPYFDPHDFMDEYKKLSCITGRDIYVLRGEKHLPARAIKINDDASLVVEYPDKTKETLFYGDISIRI